MNTHIESFWDILRTGLISSSLIDLDIKSIAKFISHSFKKIYNRVMNLFKTGRSITFPDAEDILLGRTERMQIVSEHYVLKTSMLDPFPTDCQKALFGMGCFWGVERKFWDLSGVYTTAVGYAAGGTPNPTYAEVCSGMTGHNEVVLVVYRPAMINYEKLLKLFWEEHDPTQGMRQGNDLGTQYRSGIYTFDDKQQTVALASQANYQSALSRAGYGAITTEILAAPEFYYAEDYHQQYLAKNPAGYCGLAGTGVSCSQ